MRSIRIWFNKKDSAKYISHLDLNRFMLRAFRRTGLPIWYTEGYNPHPYITFALALSLGYESDCEIMDFNLNSEIDFDEIVSKLNAVMPEGIEFISAFAPVNKITAIARSEFSVKMFCDDTQKLMKDFSDFLQRDSIIVEKKTKKGMSEIDLKPSVETSELVCDDSCVSFNVILPAGTQTNYNPSLLIDAFKNVINYPIDMVKICRNSIISDNGEKFL
jgi:radical SAM-linked protein